MSTTKPPPALPVDHPVWQAALRAPFIRPETDEEREGVAAAMKSGKVIPGADVTAEIARRRALLHR